jgi:hypothetical protein
MVSESAAMLYAIFEKLSKSAGSHPEGPNTFFEGLIAMKNWRFQKGKCTPY